MHGSFITVIAINWKYQRSHSWAWQNLVPFRELLAVLQNKNLMVICHLKDKSGQHLYLSPTFDMIMLLNHQNFAKRRTSMDFVKLELGVFIVQNVIWAFVWAIQETVLLLIIANNCDNSHDIGQRSNHLLFRNIYAFGQMILLHNDYFGDNTFIGFYF